MVTLPPRYSNIVKQFTGGMSEAFLCEDANLSRNVLVKSLQVGVEESRLLEEIRALQEIRSPHVVQIYDVIKGTRGEIVGIVEEYLPGDDLTELPTPASPAEALPLLYQMASGIADIHEHDRVHRDIKPNNMKFDAEGCLKIFDFGLSKIDGGSASTRSITFTEGYAAPELFKRRGSGTFEFTRAVDTFAFGATALEYLTGQLHDDLCQTPPAIPSPNVNFSSIAIKFPTDLIDTLNSCLSADANNRPEMSYVKALISRHLLYNRHRAVITNGGQILILEEANKGVRVSAGEMGSVAVSYNGFQFKLLEAVGSVYVNNMGVGAGFVLPGSCVISIGPPSAGSKRAFITVDVSHPEVMV